MLYFQANRKDLQRFLGVNDSEEMVYIRNVRRPTRREHRGPGGGRLSQGEPSISVLVFQAGLY